MAWLHFEGKSAKFSTDEELPGMWLLAIADTKLGGRFFTSARLRIYLGAQPVLESRVMWRSLIRLDFLESCGVL